MEQDNKFIRSLVQSAQSGKVVALEELFKMNLNRIYAIALRTTANKPLAGLLTQNILINAWQQLSRVRAEVSFADWLKSMAIYHSLNEIREGKLQKDKKTLKQFGGDSKQDKHFTDPVEKAIYDLPDKQRITVVLHLIENYSSSEIADLQSSSKSKTDEAFTGAIENIGKSIGENHSAAEIVARIKKLPKEIEPQIEIIPHALEAIREVKIEEFNEAEKVSEAKAEPPEEKEDFEVVVKKEKVKEKKSEKKKIRFGRNPILAILIVGLLIAAVIYFMTYTEVWNISDHTGNFMLNESVNTGTEVSPNDVISTEASSSVIVSIPDVGKIKLLQNTSLKRQEEKNTAQLLSGSVIIQNSGSLEKFRLAIPSAVIEDFYVGNNYTVSLDDKGNSFIKVSSGWLQVSSQNGKVIFPEKYELKVSKERGMGVPYISGSNSSFVTQLDEYIFNGKKLNILGIVLSKSSVKDALTLWNLLQLVDERQRDLVYVKLEELVPPPDGTDKQGLLNLDSKMLFAWLDKIEWNL